MHNGHQIGIRNDTPKGDLVASGITVGVGDLPPDKNPDQEQSITYNALKNEPHVQKTPNAQKNGLTKENLAQIQPADSVSFQYDSDQPKPNIPQTKKISSITISGDSIDLKDVLEVQNVADDMLNSGDAAGFNNAIRDEEYGAVATTLRNSFGDKSILEQSK